MHTESSATNPVLNATSIPAPPPDLNKVAGWLTVFRVQIVWCGIGTLAKSGEHVTHSTLILAGILLASGISLAQMLSSRSRHALRFVKWYLIGRIILTSLAVLVNPAAFMLLIPDVIWMLYFHESERVRVVFGRNLFHKAANA